MTVETAMILSLIIPSVGAVLIPLFGRHPNLRETVTLATAVALFVVVFIVIQDVLAGGRPSVVLIEILPGLDFVLVAEPLGAIFAGIASLLWIVTTIYSIGYMRGHHEKNQTRFYCYFAISLASTVGVAFSGNLLTLFTFYEILTICTFPLVTHSGTDEARKAGRIYLGFLLGTSIGLQLPAIIVIWLLAGTLDFQDGGILAGHASDGMIGFLLILYMFGIGKAALMPIHRWLPAAMVAPTPVSALLHAVAVVKAGVFTVVKVIVYIFGTDTLMAADWNQWIIYIAGFTIIAASTIALQQDNLKRRLAFSTVSQLSYVVMAAAVLAPASIVGAAFHIAAHAFGKITLFFAAGSILVASHKTEVSQLSGIGRRMPWTMGAFAIASLSMIGLPPTAGFISKWYMVQGAWQADQITVLAILLGSTLLNAGYFLPIVYSAFFKTEAAPAAGGNPAHGDGHHDNGHASNGHHGDHHGSHDHGEAPLPIVIAITFTAAMTIVLFFAPGVVLDLIGQLPGQPVGETP
jgi:multicomponent Na+:H+ antiporter subunit D